MNGKIAPVSAWLLLAAIVLVTLSPIEWRPQTGHDLLERVLAFVALGVAFGVGYPRRLAFATAITLAAAAGLEAAQLVAPGRHARVLDAFAKLAGGLTGVLLACLWVTLSDRLRWSRHEPD